MRTLEQRAALDDYEVQDEYDFSDAVRGRFYQPKKVSTTLELDNDLLMYLKKKAAEEHLDCNQLINSLLRESLSSISRKTA